VATLSAGGQDSIGLRCPSHPVAQALLREAAALGCPGVGAQRQPLRSGQPTSAAHVQGEFGPDLLVLDGGDCEVGIESTIVDCSRAHPVLLRPGRLTRAELEAVLGEPLRERDAAAPRASGTLTSHYAPRARVRLMDGDSLRQALSVLPAPAPGQRRPWRYIPAASVRPRHGPSAPCRMTPQPPPTNCLRPCGNWMPPARH
jgi:L-threonylcarbamoyladenylate synthase